MAITNGYCTLVQLKARLSITDVNDDTVLEAVVDAVSREIDELCNRRFYTTALDETRYFTAEFGDVLYPGDLLSITTLATDEDDDRDYDYTWTTDDYDLEPFNAALDGRPYEEIRTTPEGDYAFPLNRKGVKIIGKWGWSTTPHAIEEATLIQSYRIWKRSEAPFGVAGSAEMGQLPVLPKLDPDVQMFLMPYRRMAIGGV